MMFFANSFTVALALVAVLASPVNAVKVKTQPPVDLGTAADFAILSKTGVTTTGKTSVKGNMGVSPITSTAMTGFSLVLDSSKRFSKSSLVTGQIFGPNYAAPTPSKMTTAVSDMQTAYTDAAGRVNPDFTELGAGSIQGKTLTPGLYKWGSSVDFTSSLTFNGDENAVWILQIAGDFKVGAGARITLTGGAKAKNIFFQIGGKAIIGTTAHIEGIFLVKTRIVFKTGSSLKGAALSQTAVTLDAATIVKAPASQLRRQM